VKGFSFVYMALSPKRWRVAPEAPAAYLSQFPRSDWLLVQVLYNRGIRDPAGVTAFLDGGRDEANPFALEGMHDAVTRIRQALRRKEQVAVYGDFDVDGLTATALIVQTLRALGGHVQPYIPRRVDEGYGLNEEALSALAGDGVSLVVTVDCGVRAIDEIGHANQLGLDVVVTDHHSVGRRLPEAVAVIDPKRDGFSDCAAGRCRNQLAGSGVAYRLAQALLRSHDQAPVTTQDVSLREEDLLDLVALGTVADLVPLQGENRTLVRRGLERLNGMTRPGVRALCERAGLGRGAVDATAIGYILGPRLNAAGRIADAKTAYQLLLTDRERKAEQLAAKLDSLNRERQHLTREAYEIARQLALDSEGEPLLLFAASPEFLPGIVGLAAGRLADEFHRPAVVVEVGEETSRGSCRSIPGFHITQALDACADLLLRHGGHAAAAGFTVASSDLDTLADRLKKIASDKLSDADLTPVLDVDAEIALTEMSWDLLETLSMLEPCGRDNERPLFVSRDIPVRYYRAVGREGRHLKMALSDGRATWDAIAFRQGEWAGQLPDMIDVAYHLELNEWNGQRRLQLNVQDIRPAGTRSGLGD
jgi:single-stranded-DNA-specific exonuclease